MKDESFIKYLLNDPEFKTRLATLPLVLVYVFILSVVVGIGFEIGELIVKYLHLFIFGWVTSLPM